MILIANDHMIQHFDFHQLAGANQIAGHFYVGLARRRLPAWVIVHKYDCRRSHTVYMQRHPRRDHGFTIPDPLLTEELNIPNACNRCHADKPATWAVKYVDEWYGTNMNRPTRERARWISAAENGNPAAKAKLIGLLADTNQPAYWRAVAATFLAPWADEPTAQAALLAALKNEHPLVRERAVRSLEPAIGNTNVLAAMEPMLNDPLRNVRVSSAWVLRATVDMRSQAGCDLQRMLDMEADQPTGQFEAAMFCLSRNQPTEALEHLKKTTAWDPISPPFLCALAQVQDQLGQLGEALKTLDRAQVSAPEDPHIPFVRATILTRNKRDNEAKTALNRALQIDPDFKAAQELLRQTQ